MIFDADHAGGLFEGPDGEASETLLAAPADPKPTLRLPLRPRKNVNARLRIQVRPALAPVTRHIENQLHELCMVCLNMLLA